jgi:hypothetical protein
MKFRIKPYALLILCLFASYTAFSQEPGHWESIFGEGESCPYLVPDRDLGTTWQEIGFDDSDWEIGEPGFGFGDNDDVTILPSGTQSVYIRIAFDVDDISDISDL